MRLKGPTRVCKLCFKEYEETDLIYVLNDKVDICKYCYKEIKAKFINFEVCGYKALSIYDYDPKIQALIYQLKGCFDIEIAHIFLERYRRELSLRYHGYVIVPIPSYEKDDQRREFNHVEEMFRPLNLPMVMLLTKTSSIKQANSTSRKRHDISKYLKLVSNEDLSKRKILLVDDVYTTGSTMKTAIELVEKLHPKKIRVLVISKTEMK